ncbi:MAG: 5-methyltetrahydropteroyltriglutamate--homocysteine S-methyltransferase [Faecalicoccus sp.]|nr:5-methyltetrahydropteroyltriglutamate--homocysteine S-methyltransferase [Faecalicoccus sp.]
MTVKYTPFRYDYVGSFLRPEPLKKARTDYEAGRIDAKQLKEVEDDAIYNLVKKIKELGYHVITDGEFRRSTWHLDFMWGFSGVSHSKTKTGLPFHGEQAMIDDTYLTGKIALRGEHPFVEHFRFVKALEDENTVAKQTIPAPAQFLAQLVMPFAWGNTKKYYEDEKPLIDDLVNAYKTVIKQLYDAGCRNIQFDDCTWGMLVDPAVKAIYGTDEDGLNQVKAKYLEINNRVIEGKPDDLVINTHVCRGNYHSTYANQGPYDSVSDVLFGGENVNTFYLEFDDERSGDFSSLAKVSGDKKIVLGLITTKTPKLEDKDKIKERIREAAKYVPLDRLYLSPQCGFASCEIGNKLTEDQQWNKLKLVKEIAEEIWEGTENE